MKKITFLFMFFSFCILNVSHTGLHKNKKQARYAKKTSPKNNKESFQKTLAKKAFNILQRMKNKTYSSEEESGKILKQMIDTMRMLNDQGRSYLAKRIEQKNKRIEQKQFNDDMANLTKLFSELRI